MPKTPPTSATPPTVEGFLRTVLRSGLLDRDALQALLRSLPVDRRNDAEAVAEHLVKAGRLTRFQARKLLAGTALGLVLGPFHVLAPIARGGMGMVYLARDTRSDQLRGPQGASAPTRPVRRNACWPASAARWRCRQRVSHPHLAWTYEVA